MSLVPKGKELQAFTRVDESEEQVDFSRRTVQEFFKNDIVRARITGTIPNLPNLHVSNFIESILHDVFAEDVDFTECDFKDTLIRGALFERCSFENCTLATSFFSDCEFKGCTFYNTAVHSSEFHRVRFTDCNMKNLLIKSSRFLDSELVSCEANNKIMEMSTLDNTRFVATNIQLQTITGNFGLTIEDLDGASIRSGRVREGYQYLSTEDIESELLKDLWSPLEKLRMEYFLRPNLSYGSPYLDQALNLTRWAQIYKNPGSFVELLEGFSEFIAHLYASNRLTAHSILVFHDITTKLAELVPQSEDLHRLAMSLGGTRIVLSRIVEEYLEVLELLLSKGRRSIVFLVEGPLDERYYSQELAPWFDSSTMRIDFLIEHNSPLELGITSEQVATLIPLIAGFLATRTKLEIVRIRDRHLNDAQKEETDGRLLPMRQSREDDQLLSFRAGYNEHSKHFEIQVRALLSGSLLMDLRLQVSTQFAGKIRGVLRDLLS